MMGSRGGKSSPDFLTLMAEFLAAAKDAPAPRGPPRRDPNRNHRAPGGRAQSRRCPPRRRRRSPVSPRPRPRLPAPRASCTSARRRSPPARPRPTARTRCCGERPRTWRDSSSSWTAAWTASPCARRTWSTGCAAAWRSSRPNRDARSNPVANRTDAARPAGPCRPAGVGQDAADRARRDYRPAARNRGAARAKARANC